MSDLTWLTLVNPNTTQVFLGTPILSDIPLYSPFIKSVRVLGRAHIHKGKKRVRRAKLYYLWEKRDPKEFSIST